MTGLGDQLTINHLHLRNRLVLPPLTTNYGSSEGMVTKEILQFYRERSKDMGLVIVEATAVRGDGRIVPGSLGLWEDAHISGMRQLVDTIKQQGAAAAIQVNHAGPRCVPCGGEMQGASPSGMPFRPDVEPLIMTIQQIEQLTNDFADAVGRAAEAGFDSVEIHGAHFYLISQFLSPLTNQRKDLYGGNAKGRATIAFEIIEASRERVGHDYPLMFRLNAIEKVEGGQTVDDSVIVSRLLEDAGIDILDVSGIAKSSWKEHEGRQYLAASSALPKDDPSGANVYLAQKIKQAVGLPVIAVGKLGDAKVASAAISESNIDMIAIGRQMICDPDTAGKILSGRGDQIIPCDECLKCFATIGRGVPMACKVNKNLPFADQKNDVEYG
jgi:2,4-dienoyl-CoA reductase-like NADH-dependent reductase (Old Yellow Enzyme family)